MDKSIFGAYNQVNFSKCTCVEDMEQILDKIFTNNPNFWHNNKLYYGTGTGDCLELVKHLLEHKIKIYEYKYDTPPYPKEDNERDMLLFKTYYEWSKAKYYDLALIFWNANKFLNKSGHSLINFGSATYRNLQILKNNYDEFDFEHKIYDEYSLYDFLKNPNNFTPLDENISVYWGKCEAYQILGDVMKGTKYSMIFPYPIEDSNKLSCYLLESSSELIAEYNDKARKSFELFIKGKDKIMNIK